jgi:predicted dehydrogenase
MNPQTAKLCGDRYGAATFAEADPIINDPTIGLVSIYTPTVTHCDITIAAIKAGKHVLVEKPLINIVKEDKHLIKEAEKHNVKLAVGFVGRFNPAIPEAIKRVSEVEIHSTKRAHPKVVH